MPLCLPPARAVREHKIARRREQEGPDEIASYPSLGKTAPCSGARGLRCGLRLRPASAPPAPSEEQAAAEPERHRRSRRETFVQHAPELGDALVQRQSRLLGLALLDTDTLREPHPSDPIFPSTRRAALNVMRRASRGTINPNNTANIKLTAAAIRSAAPGPRPSSIKPRTPAASSSPHVERSSTSTASATPAIVARVTPARRDSSAATSSVCRKTSRADRKMVASSPVRLTSEPICGAPRAAAGLEVSASPMVAIRARYPRPRMSAPSRKPAPSAMASEAIGRRDTYLPTS